MSAYVPVATYRLQLNREFTFRDAFALVPYLDFLGISDAYLSPVFKAQAGSTHGYDLCNQRELNPELGSDDDWSQLVGALRDRGMGIVLDVVANHMGTHPTANTWWRDVLENGPGSHFAHYFDIDWSPVKPELNGKVLLPHLEDRYGVVLERGDIRVAYAEGRFTLQHGGRDLPLAPHEYPGLLRHDLPQLEQSAAEDDPDVRELLSVITAFDHLPPPTDTDEARVAERRRESAVATERLWKLVGNAPAVAAHVERVLAWINGTQGDAASYDALHHLLERQSYRLAYWRTAADEINYRRFFDINDLAGVRVEAPDVFAATHELVGSLVARGQVRGLRIDHPDGLFDPGEYFERVQALARQSSGRALPDGQEAGADAPPGTPGDPRAIYLVIEKILGAAEPLESRWPVHGTTGYDWLNVANGVFVDGGAVHAFRRLYQRFAGPSPPFTHVLSACKTLIMRTALASELNVLAHRLNALTEANRRSRDFTLNSLRAMLREYIAELPVYRTYLSPDSCSDETRALVLSALARAAAKRPEAEPTTFRFIAEVLLPPREGSASEFAPASDAEQEARTRFAMQLQQYTGPVHAKGVEDTAFYRHNVLVSLNEVGGDPSRFGYVPDAFHLFNVKRQRAWPASMTATATHDTKLGEDVRARVNALTEWSDEWRRAVFTWSRINARHRTLLDGDWAPDRNDEYRFYQVLLGAWPLDADPTQGAPDSLVRRLVDYMLKAVREAKVHTSWINQNQPYDDAVCRFVEQSLTGSSRARFLAAFAPLWRAVSLAGVVNSLGQLVLKLACPGVPDFYQGCETWDFRLVDPDNRAPVDYTRLTGVLASVESAAWDRSHNDLAGTRTDTIRSLAADWSNPAVKMAVTMSGLRCRRAHPSTFLDGTYAPLPVVGRRSAHVLAFARQGPDRPVVAAVTRLSRALGGSTLVTPPDAWEDTVLRFPDRATSSWTNVLTGEVVGAGTSGVPLGRVFATLPVAMFLADE